MSLHSDIPFVTEKLDQNDGSTRRLQVLSCSASGCDCTKDFPVNGRAKPEDVIYNMALIGVPATLHVVFWEKTRHGSAGEIGVSLNALTIDPAAISLPGPLDDHPHK